MPSSLVNPKMNVALASRVSRSLRGAQATRAAGPTPPSRTLLIRLGVLAGVTALVFAVVREVQTRQEQLAAAKLALVSARGALQSTLNPRARAIGERVSRLLTREANSYHGAARHEQLGSLAEWDALLNRPIVYARLDVDKVSEPERFDAVLSESRKDAFVACLKQPPADRTEKELMKRVTDAFGQGAQEYTSNIHRVHDALVTLRVLDPAIDRQIERADELSPVLSLQHTWDQARIDERLPAVFGEVLVAVLDEPKLPDTPVELDGASVHGVRVAVVDISREQDVVLLRTHFDLDPSWVSERRRHQYAQGLEGCRMAYDVRTALAQPR
jgi:hypothetical protein